MTDYISKTNAELSRVVAERCGWVHEGEWECPECGFVQVLRTLSAVDGSVGVDLDQGRRVCPNDGKTLTRWVPHFAESMDACFAPGGPVECLRERGLDVMVWLGNTWEGLVIKDNRIGVGVATSDTMSRALCLVFLAATEANDAH